MVMYKLNIKEVVSLVGKKMGINSYYHPIEDVNGDYFITEVEYKICGLGVKAEYVAPVNDGINEI